jgi:flagellar protein FlaG
MNVNAVGNSKQPLQQAKLEAQPAQPAQSAQAGGANGIAAQQPASAAPPKAASSSEPQELKGSVDAINSFIKTFSNNLEFSIDEESGRTVVKLVDTETDTVLRQYPTKEALALARDIENFQGHLLKTEA